jgi:hypothetical protein
MLLYTSLKGGLLDGSKPEWGDGVLNRKPPEKFTTSDMERWEEEWIMKHYRPAGRMVRDIDHEVGEKQIKNPKISPEIAKMTRAQVLKRLAREGFRVEHYREDQAKVLLEQLNNHPDLVGARFTYSRNTRFLDSVIITLPAVRLKCPNCSYSWPYVGRRAFTTCPNCRRNIKTGIDFKTFAAEQKAKMIKEMHERRRKEKAAATH